MEDLAGHRALRHPHAERPDHLRADGRPRHRNRLRCTGPGGPTRAAAGAAAAAAGAAAGAGAAAAATGAAMTGAAVGAGVTRDTRTFRLSLSP